VLRFHYMVDRADGGLTLSINSAVADSRKTTTLAAVFTKVTVAAEIILGAPRFPGLIAGTAPRPSPAG